MVTRTSGFYLIPAWRRPRPAPQCRSRSCLRVQSLRETSSAGFARACRRRGSIQRLGEPDVVAEGIAPAAVDAIGALGRFLGELDASRLELLVRLPAVGGCEEQVPARATFRYELASLLGGLLVEPRRARSLQQDLAGIARHVHRQPAHEPQVLVGVDLQPEFPDVEVECLVLVENVDR